MWYFLVSGKCLVVYWNVYPPLVYVSTIIFSIELIILGSFLRCILFIQYVVTSLSAVLHLLSPRYKKWRIGDVPFWCGGGGGLRSLCLTPCFNTTRQRVVMCGERGKEWVAKPLPLLHPITSTKRGDGNVDQVCAKPIYPHLSFLLAIYL